MSEESTTPDLVELTRRAYEAFNRRDFDAALSISIPDVVWDSSSMMGVYEGAAAVRALWEAWLGSYEEFEQELEEVRDFRNGVSFYVVLQRGRLIGSTAFVEARYASVVEWADGLVTRATTYADIDEARAAAERLAEERGRADG